MTFQNGYAPITQLRTVAPGTQLINSTAAAFLHMVLVGKLDGTKVAPVDSYGSGYRNFAVQQVFYRAAHGSRQDAILANIDPNLHVNVAAPGYSSHGTGTRVDILFDGHSPSRDDLELAARYGFTREFGSADQNHFKHDGKTGISGVLSYDKNRLLGQFLNSKHLGKTTDAAHTGKRDRELIWLVQHYGHMTQHYPVHCIEDGITGHYTELAFTAEWNALVKAG